MSDPALPRVFAVRQGTVVPTGSWLYAWIDIETGEVAYVGGTGFDPELRAHIHLTDEDPRLGRIRASVPDALTRNFNVLVFPLPADAERAAHKQALLRLLAENGLQNAPAVEQDEPVIEVHEVLISDIATAIEQYVTRVKESA